MHNNSSRSVRKFLLVSIIAVLLAVSLISGAVSWMNTRHELSELYDQNMLQIANVIDAQHTAMIHKSSYDITTNEKQIKEEEDYFVRIRNENGKTLYVSHPSIQLPPGTQSGFSVLSYQNRDWRVFLKPSTTDQDIIEVAQVLKYRTRTIAQVSYSLLIPQLLAIPLLGLLLWSLIGSGLKPLETLSQSIADRKEMLLHPVALDKAPIEIQPLVQALNILLERLDIMVQVLRRFTADAAHELRTPLTALKLQLNVLEQATDPVEQKTGLDNLKAGIDRSIALVQQLLTLARAEPHSMNMLFTEVNLSDIVTKSVAHFIHSAAAKNMDIGIVRNTHPMMRGNAEALEVLFNNIIDNAIRYSPTGGVVDIALDETSSEIIFEVTDTGPGIAREDRPFVFERFYRGKGTTTPGTGLGLAIVKEIADRHQGYIDLETTADNRFLFRIRFMK